MSCSFRLSYWLSGSMSPHCLWIVLLASFSLVTPISRSVTPNFGWKAVRTVVVAGAFDTKGTDYTFLVDRLRSHGLNVVTVDFGVMGDPPFPPDLSNADVARASGVDITTLRESKDKAVAMRVMAEGLPRILLRLREEGRLDGVCGMGGSGSTAILSAGMRALPIGVPKLLVSTVAAGDVSPYVGSTDLTHDAFRCRCGRTQPRELADLYQRCGRNSRNGRCSSTGATE